MKTRERAAQPVRSRSHSEHRPDSARGSEVSQAPGGLIQRAKLGAGSLSPSDAIYMQQTIGNQAFQRLRGGAPRSSAMARPAGDGGVIQTKLTVGAAGDKYEAEADRVAREVVGAGLVASRKPATTELRVQRASGAAGGDLDPALEDKIHGAKGSGSPLSPGVRSMLEPRLGADLTSVRTHTGGDAEALSGALGARAFTHKNDIYYGAGQSPDDLALTTHEVVHTIQQGASPSLGEGSAASDVTPAGEGRIQRDVGFEFESPTTKVHKPDEAGAKPGERYNSKNTFAAKVGSYDVTSDSGNLEIVTNHFPETLDGREALDETMASIEAYCLAVDKRGIAWNRQRAATFEQLTDIAPVVDDDAKGHWIVAPINGNIIAHPQATAGVEMSKLYGLLDSLTDSASETYKTTGWDSREKWTSQLPSLRRGVVKAAEIVDGIEDDKSYEKLKGMLAHVLGLLCVAKDSEGTKVQYAKYLMPVMQRTDLGAMYKLLDPHEKDAFVAKRDQILEKAGVAADAKLFPGGTEESYTDDTTVGAFLDGIVANRDVLRDLHLAGSERRDDVDIGATATQESRKGALVELRRLKDKVSFRNWRTMALSIFDVITMLNQGKKVTDE